MSMIFLGIDPGRTGALVALDEHGNVILAELCPVLSKDFNDTEMNRVVRDAVSEELNVHAGIEKCGTRPGESLRGAFSFGEGVGIWRGILAAHAIGWRWIAPQAWQVRALSGERKPKARKELKDAITRSAIRRWPRLSSVLHLKKNQGIADAAWIADHIRLTHTPHTPSD